MKKTFIGILCGALTFITLIVCCIEFHEEESLINNVLSCFASVIAIFAIIVTYQTCYKTLVDSKHSLDLEFQKEKISKIQQELANRFEKFSPNEIVPYSLFKDAPTKEKAIEYMEKLQTQYCKCSGLLDSADLLYSDDSKHPESKEFLKSYKSMMKSSIRLISILLLKLREEDQSMWTNYMPILVLWVDNIMEKYQKSRDKADEYISVLNNEFKAQYKNKIDNILNLNQKIDIEDPNLLEEEDEEEDVVVNN